jgi:hypothetical protein
MDHGASLSGHYRWIRNQRATKEPRAGKKPATGLLLPGFNRRVLEASSSEDETQDDEDDHNHENRVKHRIPPSSQAIAR